MSSGRLVHGMVPPPSGIRDEVPTVSASLYQSQKASLLESQSLQLSWECRRCVLGGNAVPVAIPMRVHGRGGRRAAMPPAPLAAVPENRRRNWRRLTEQKRDALFI